MFSRNPLSSDEAITVNAIFQVGQTTPYMSALVASGFTRIPDRLNRTHYWQFLPCPLGTFSNSSSKGAEGCLSCPPGIE